MKMLYLAAKLDQFGGIEKYNRTLIATLRELGVDVVVVERPLGGAFAKALFALRFCVALFTQRPRFIYCSHLYFSPLCLITRRYLGIPYGVSVYGIETANITGTAYVRTLSAAEKVVYLFEATAECVVIQVPEVRERLVLIPNSVDGTIFTIKERKEALVKRFGLEGAKVVLTIGRMSKLDGDNKGYRRVIKAMVDVVRAVPNAKYLLAGSGDDIEGVRTLVRELGLEKSVVIVSAPSYEEIVDYFNLGDVFVLPSKNEGFPPIVLLEALACGVPVIGGNQKGAEVFAEKKLGMVVPSDDVSAISAAIVNMLTGKADARLLNREMLRAKTLEWYGRPAYIEQVRKFIARINE